MKKPVFPQSNDEVLQAAREGKLDFFKRLSPPELAMALSCRTSNGHSPLMLAVYRGHYDLVEFFLNHGGNPNDSDFNRNTLLMGAAFKGHSAIMQLLIRQGANIEAENEKSMRAQHFAALFGRREAFQILSSSSYVKLFYNTAKAWILFLKPNR